MNIMHASFDRILIFFLLLRLVSSLASPSIPPPPSVSVPVWSLASLADASVTSMNIVTFASPVSVAPPKLWVVSLYTNTMTRQAFLDSKVGVLQLLTTTQQQLVPVLGKRSGFEADYSKKEACANLGYQWVNGEQEKDDSFCAFLDRNDGLLSLLPKCATYIKLKLLSVTEAGDHEVALCEVLKTGSWDENTEAVLAVDAQPKPLDPSLVLYTSQLRQEGII